MRDTQNPFASDMECVEYIRNERGNPHNACIRRSILELSSVGEDDHLQAVGRENSDTGAFFDAEGGDAGR